MTTPLIYKINSNNTFSQEVVGESNYQNVFEKICGKRTDKSVDKKVDVLVAPEPQNPYDSNAFVVLLKGKTIGYLPRDTAKNLRELFDKYQLPNKVALSVKGQIRGGWIRDKTKASYGIWLDLPTIPELEKQIQNISTNKNNNQSSKPAKKQLPFIFILIPSLMILCIICAGIGMIVDTVISKSTSTEIANQASVITQEPSAIPTKTQKTIDPTKTPKPTPTLYVAGIPDLTPIDVKLNLEKRKFTCSDVKEVQAEEIGTWYSWICDRDETMLKMHVEMLSRTLIGVDSIDATIIQYYNPSDEIASTFLGFMATFAFINDKNSQTEAKKWVEKALPKVQKECIETTIQNISFKLCGPPTAHWLEIGNMD